MNRAPLFLAICAITATAGAATPQLNRILPRGGQRGTEMDVTFDGLRLKDAQEVIIYDKGFEVTKLEAAKPEQVKVHIKIAGDCALGEHAMRVRCASGISDLRTFWVGPFPTTQAAATNTSWDTPQPLPMNITATGVINNEQVHYYKIEAKKGQRISAEVEGIRLGGQTNGAAMFDPYLSLVDMSKFELATSDDTALLKQDPYISLIAPKDGPFILAIRESSFGGSGDSNYRMHVGTFPRPAVTYPLGGKAGETVSVKFIGDPSGPITQDIKLPDQPSEMWPVFASHDNQTPPSANHFRVSSFPNVMQEGDNRDISRAQPAKIEMPLAFNGILTQNKEQDYYTFTGHKGQPVEIAVWARRLGSPIDSVIIVWNAKRQYLAENDDANNPDSNLRFTPPEDGEYIVGIRDHLGVGGPDYVYRIELTSPRSTVVLSIPNANPGGQPTQELQTIPVPRGNRYATLIRSIRSGAAGDMSLAATSLPDGVKMVAEPFRPQNDATPVIFEAGEDAPVAGKLSDFVAQSADGKEPISSQLTQVVDLVLGNNNTVYLHCDVHQLAVAVTQEVPFRINLVQPKAPLVQAGQLKLKVQVERESDFKGPVHLKLLFNPPGVNAQPVDLPADKNEVDLPISANEGASLKSWKICVVGNAEAGGPAWVSTQFVDLTIAQPYMTGKMQMAAIEQNTTGQVVCELTPSVKFEGKAKLELQGLPSNTTAEPREVSAEDTKVVFDVVATAKAPIGQSNSMTIQATIKQDGEDVVHTVAKAGVIRIDPPKTAAPPKPQVAVAPVPAVAAPKVLTRLEKLRLEQEQEKK